MRTELLNYFRSLKLKNFRISDELPFSNGATTMYLKNSKTIYADLSQVSEEVLLPVLGNHGVTQEVQTVSVFFSTDAKNLPSDYEQSVGLLKAAKNSTIFDIFYRKEVDTDVSYEGDLLITQLDFRFTKLT